MAQHDQVGACGEHRYAGRAGPHGTVGRRRLDPHRAGPHRAAGRRHVDPRGAGSRRRRAAGRHAAARTTTAWADDDAAAGATAAWPVEEGWGAVLRDGAADLDHVDIVYGLHRDRARSPRGAIRTGWGHPVLDAAAPSAGRGPRPPRRGRATRPRRAPGTTGSPSRRWPGAAPARRPTARAAC